MNNDHKAEPRPPILIPLCIGALLTIAALLLKLDPWFEDLFYNPQSGSWLLDGVSFERFVYRFSPIPSMIFFGGGVLVALGSIWVVKWRRWRRAGMYLALCMLLGPGLVVNGIFKEFYGRPRPKQVVEYGGSMEYRPVWVVGEPRKAKSFPCGHASIGFYFMALYFACYRRNRRVARRWLAFGLFMGITIGAFRMGKGSHWFSDVVWSGLFVYFISYATAWGCGLLKEREDAVA